MKISVFGSGYVGLVQAAVLAEVGHDVLCMDIDRNKVERLAQGLASIYEPGLDALLREGLDSGRLRFSSDARLAVEHGRVQFIAVGTPPGEDGAADLGAVFAATACARTSSGAWKPTDASWNSRSSPTRNSSRKAPPSPTAGARTASWSAATTKRCAR